VKCPCWRPLRVVDRDLIIAKAASVRKDLDDLNAFLSAIFRKLGIIA
jgi:hypothetical protein